DADVDRLTWSGGPLHLRDVRRALERVASGEIEYLVLRGPGRMVVAKAQVEHVGDSSTSCISQLATAPGLEGLGLAAGLMSVAEERMRRRGRRTSRLSVEPAHGRARALYTHLGYREAGRRTASWDMMSADGAIVKHVTELIDMEKPLSDRRASAKRVDGKQKGARQDGQKGDHPGR